MDPAALSAEQRAKALALLRQGHSQGSIAKQIGCSQTTISRLAKKEGISSMDTGSERMVKARANYDLATRLELINEAFERGRELLGTIATATQYRELVTGLAILVDKRRLEEGEATSRSEVSTNDARDRLAARIADITARRAATRSHSEPN